MQHKILICPLDWGLGHASRCIPVIRLLLKNNKQVIIAASGRPLELLKKEFPTVEYIEFKGYSINYGKGSMILKMFLSIPGILIGINKEHKRLKEIIKEKKIDILISDNRFGLWTKDVPCVFITHQLMIKSPFAEGLLHKINLFYINKYDDCWIPDMEGEANLSGDLSHKYPLPGNACFIGVLSRFDNAEEKIKADYIYDAMVILSGPEPQRSILEKIVKEQISQANLLALIVCGKTEEKYYERMEGRMKIVNHLNGDEMQEAIMQSKIIIARSGYSTIMDLAVLGKRAVFIPTPGQTEQEYLAKLMKRKGIAFYQIQNEFDLKKALVESESYSGFETVSLGNKLEERINFLLSKGKARL